MLIILFSVVYHIAFSGTIPVQVAAMGVAAGDMAAFAIIKMKVMNRLKPILIFMIFLFSARGQKAAHLLFRTIRLELYHCVASRLPFNANVPLHRDRLWHKADG